MVNWVWIINVVSWKINSNIDILWILSHIRDLYIWVLNWFGEIYHENHLQKYIESKFCGNPSWPWSYFQGHGNSFYIWEITEAPVIFAAIWCSTNGMLSTFGASQTLRLRLLLQEVTWPGHAIVMETVLCHMSGAGRGVIGGVSSACARGGQVSFCRNLKTRSNSQPINLYKVISILAQMCIAMCSSPSLP